MPKSVLKPQELLERIWCHQKISPGCNSLRRWCKTVALQAGSLVDLPSCTALRTLTKIWYTNTQCPPPSWPSFSPSRQASMWLQSLQICTHSSRHCQPLQRSWAFDFERFCWGCKSFSVNLQMQRFNMATGAEGWPWPQVHVKHDQRDGKPTQAYIRCGCNEIHRDQAIVEHFNCMLSELLFSLQYRGNALPCRPTVTAWVKRIPDIVSALNNEVTHLTGKKPADAIQKHGRFRKTFCSLLNCLLVWTKNSPLMWMFAISTNQASLTWDQKGYKSNLVFERLQAWKSRNQAKWTWHLLFAWWPKTKIGLQRAVGCPAKHTAAACSCHMKLDWLSVDPIQQNPAFVIIISTQAQFLLLITSHVLCSSGVNHRRSSVFCSVNIVAEHHFETLPRDVTLSLQHSLRAELLFFAVLFINIEALCT